MTSPTRCDYRTDRACACQDGECRVQPIDLGRFEANEIIRPRFRDFVFLSVVISSIAYASLITLESIEAERAVVNQEVLAKW